MKGEFRTWADKGRIQLIPASLYTQEGNDKVENYNGQLQYTLALVSLAHDARDQMDLGTVAKRWYPHLGDAIAVRKRHISQVTRLSAY